MASIVLRTAMVYIFLMLAMRIMGKRQLGELQVSELVTTLLLSELVALPIYEQNVPIAFSIIPVLLLLSFEIISSFLSSKFPKFKKIVEGVPSFIISKGQLIQSELKKNRIGLDELLEELRLQSITDISQVEYAILEQNGRLSVIPKCKEKPATVSDIGKSIKECGLSHPVILDGKINKSNLKILGKSEKWLSETLQKKRLKTEEIELFAVNDNDEETLILLENEAKRK